MRRILISLGVPIALIALAWAAGAMIPRDHVATRMALYHQPPEVIWRMITDVEGQVGWREGVTSVRRLPDENGMPGWVETSDFGELPIRVIQWDPPRRMVARIADDSLPFGGTWTYEVDPVEGGATLRLTESGFIKPALFRLLSRFVFGYTATMETYLESLGTQFGEEVSPAP